MLLQIVWKFYHSDFILTKELRNPALECTYHHSPRKVGDHILFLSFIFIENKFCGYHWNRLDETVPMISTKNVYVRK